MTKRKITMITNVNFVKVANLCEPNALFDFGGACTDYLCHLSGAGWFAENVISSDGLYEIFNVIFGVPFFQGSHELWLFIGNDCWQPDTKIVRHRKLWGYMRGQGIGFAGSCESAIQKIVESDCGVKFFGALKVGCLKPNEIFEIINNWECAYMAFLPIGVDVSNLLDSGWEGNLREDCKFVRDIVDLNGVLLKKVGWFDDAEIGVLAISSAENINAFRS